MIGIRHSLELQRVDDNLPRHEFRLAARAGDVIGALATASLMAENTGGVCVMGPVNFRQGGTNGIFRRTRIARRRDFSFGVVRVAPLTPANGEFVFLLAIHDVGDELRRPRQRPLAAGCRSACGSSVPACPAFFPPSRQRTARGPAPASRSGLSACPSPSQPWTGILGLGPSIGGHSSRSARSFRSLATFGSRRILSMRSALSNVSSAVNCSFGV